MIYVQAATLRDKLQSSSEQNDIRGTALIIIYQSLYFGNPKNFILYDHVSQHFNKKYG